MADSVVITLAVCGLPDHAIQKSSIMQFNGNRDLEYVSRRTVGVFWEAIDPRGCHRWGIATAFLLDVDGHLFLVTASHVINGTDQDPGFRELMLTHDFKRCTLVPAHKGKHPDSIEFYLDPRRFIDFRALGELMGKRPKQTKSVSKVLAREAAGILVQNDVAVMKLPQYYVDHLRSCGSEAFSECEMVPRDSIPAGFFEKELKLCLYGFPTATNEQEDGTGKFMFLEFGLVPVDYRHPLFDVEPTWNRSNFDAGIQGTSGGPVVLFGLEHPLLIGVQSTQVSQSNSGYPKRLTGVVAPNVFDLIRLWQDSGALESAEYLSNLE